MKEDARAKQWKARVAQWKASGLSQSKFARQQGLNGNQLSYWIGRYRQTDASPVSSALLPVQIQSPSKNASLPLGTRLTSPSGWTVHLPELLSPQALIELIRVLP
jgi:hypothetical protein